MNITKQEREELNTLSKEIFGVSSRWQKLETVVKPVMREVTEEVPGENGAESTTQTKSVAVIENGARKLQTKINSYEDIKGILLEMKERLDNFKALQKQQALEAQVAKLKEETTKRVQEQLSGSSNS